MYQHSRNTYYGFMNKRQNATSKSLHCSPSHAARGEQTSPTSQDSLEMSSGRAPDPNPNPNNQDFEWGLPQRSNYSGGNGSANNQFSQFLGGFGLVNQPGFMRTPPSSFNQLSPSFHQAQLPFQNSQIPGSTSSLSPFRGQPAFQTPGSVHNGVNVNASCAPSEYSQFGRHSEVLAEQQLWSKNGNGEANHSSSLLMSPGVVNLISTIENASSSNQMPLEQIPLPPGSAFQPLAVPVVIRPERPGLPVSTNILQTTCSQNSTVIRKETASSGAFTMPVTQSAAITSSASSSAPKTEIKEEEKTFSSFLVTDFSKKFSPLSVSDQKPLSVFVPLTVECATQSTQTALSPAKPKLLSMTLGFSTVHSQSWPFISNDNLSPKNSGVAHDLYVKTSLHHIDEERGRACTSLTPSPTFKNGSFEKKKKKNGASLSYSESTSENSPRSSEEVVLATKEQGVQYDPDITWPSTSSKNSVRGYSPEPAASDHTHENSPNAESDNGEMGNEDEQIYSPRGPKRSRDSTSPPNDTDIDAKRARQEKTPKQLRRSLQRSINERKQEEARMRVEAAKARFKALSLEFLVQADLEHAMAQCASKYPEATVIKLKSWLEKKKESRKNPHYIRTDIGLDAVFPDHDDYRHCKQYLRDMCFGTAKMMPFRRRGARVPKNAPPFTLFGSLYQGTASTAAEVDQAAEKWFEKHSNDIYKKTESLDGPEIDKTVVEEEQKFYKEKYGDTQLDGFTGTDKNRLQAPVITLNNKEELESNDLKRILNSASITVVKNVCKAADIDTDIFQLDALVEMVPDLMMDCLYQNPQSADGNYNTEGTEQWKTSSWRYKKELSWFQAYMKKRFAKCEDSFAKMLNSCDYEKTEKMIMEEMLKEQGEILEAELDEDMPWSIFGTNIDMQDREAFAIQHANLDKLPEWLRPEFDGNLLNLIGEDVLGINTVQIYVKPPGSRTAAHMENSLMASINVNLGPGNCIWFAVPYEYWGEIYDMVKKRKCNYFDQDYWPNEQELRDAGIPVMKFEQKPDELVYVNTGCFHWVQAAGYCVNVSWNVGQPTFTQLSISMIAHSHNILNKYMHHVPIIKIAWEIAKRKLYLDNEDISNVIRSIMIRSMAHAKWYEKEVRRRKKNKIYKPHELEFSIPAVIRCHQCGAEMFHVVKWYLGNAHVSSTAICNGCTNIK
uniref:JmjC domain-containing protein n=1 Tax=Caenorhabditis japonica TaxID=281687 RepID=A0A8R1HHI2_CAEJA